MPDFCPVSSTHKVSCFLMSINTWTTLNPLARVVLNGLMDNRETIDQELSLLKPERTCKDFRRPQKLLSESSAETLLTHQNISNPHPTSAGPFWSSPPPSPSTHFLQNWPEQRKQPLTLAAPILCLPGLNTKRISSNRLACLRASSCYSLHMPRGLYSC